VYGTHTYTHTHTHTHSMDMDTDTHMDTRIWTHLLYIKFIVKVITD